MKLKVFSAVAALVTLFGFSSAALACDPGYKRVKIQGNWVCMLDASASNNLTAKQPAPPPYATIKQKRKKIRK